ncbi:MAG: hypothetical protein GY755_23110 [Chloroflexi bacterium]|nr:hypothetical protein [Chloroflexota bacterium]
MDTFFPALPELPETVTFDGVGLLLLCVGLVLLLSGINAIRVTSKKVEVANKKQSAIAGLILALLGLGLIAYPEPGSSDKPDTETPPTEVVIASSTPVPEEPVDSDPTLTPIPPDAEPLLLDGDIFNVKCLENDLWDPITNISVSSQTANEAQSCLELAEWGISLNSSELNIYLDASRTPGLYGVMAPIPATSYIEFSVQIESLKSGNLRFGVIADGESLKDIDGAFAEIQDNGRVQLLFVKNGVETKMGAYKLEESADGTLQFSIAIKGNDLRIQQVGVSDNYQTMSFPFPTRNLFLGYEDEGRSDIRVRYFDLSVEER